MGENLRRQRQKQALAVKDRSILGSGHIVCKGVSFTASCGVWIAENSFLQAYFKF